jgi:hypothetical protein
MEALSGGEWSKVNSGSPAHTNLVSMLEAKGIFKLQPAKARDLTTQRLDINVCR